MPRIPEHEINELKRSLSLLSVAESQGHKFKKSGQDSYTCLCPFHKEKTPSLVITPSKNLFHCFGCGAAGSVLDWLMKTEHLTFLNGLVRLRELGKTFGVLPLPQTQSASKSPPSLAASVAKPKTPAPKPIPRQKLADLDEDGQALLSQVIDFYQQRLRESPLAQEWLTRRGINHPELISHFRLGYAGEFGIGGEAGILPMSQSKGDKQLREKLGGLGLLRETTKRDHFRGCMVVPVIGWAESACVAHRGRVLQLYGRRENERVHKGSPKHLYLPSPLVGVWNEEALVSSSEIILCEALIDAMTFWCAGFRNVIAAYGVNGFTDDHLKALEHHGIKRVMIAYDRDEAGDNAALKLAPQLLELGMEVWRVQFPKGMDANEYAVKSENATQSLHLVLQQAKWMGHGSTPGTVFHHEKVIKNEVQEGEKSLPLAATAALPVTPSVGDIACEQTASGELLFTFGPRVWRIRGHQKNHSSEVMKVNAQVRHVESGAFHVDTVDIYNARGRGVFVKTASIELGCDESVIKRDMGRVLLKLEELQEETLNAALAPKTAAVVVSGEAESAALALLKSPDLAQRIVNDLASCGVVGESTNLLTGYLAAVSRKLDKPLAVLIQSSSAAGKSSLMDAVLSLIPEEERVQYSAMTGQSLFYLGETNLQHKILAIAEEEGVRQAAYALKLLQSDGELTIASTGKNESTGDLVTKQYTVKGPVMLMLTTTAIDVDEELLNRCLVLTVNESREQTQAIHAIQRHKQTLEGLLAESEKSYITELHQNAQRLLRPLHVVNPFAHQLTFLSDKTRTRRDHMKYLTLIQSITLLHQYQREIKRVEHRGQWLEYIEVTREDIALANRLAHDILGRTLDEMPPQTRKLLLLIQGMVKTLSQQQACKANEVRFTRRDIREYTHWSDSQLKNHCLRLVEMEYLLVHGGSRGHLLHYELLYDGNGPDEAHLCGLLDIQGDSEKSDENKDGDRKSGLMNGKSVSSLGQVCPKSEGVNQAVTQVVKGIEEPQVRVGEKAVIRKKNKAALIAGDLAGISVGEVNGEVNYESSR